MRLGLSQRFLRMFKGVFGKAAAIRRPEAYFVQYIESLNEQERSQKLFQHPTERGATGFDGDTEVTVACRALGDS